MGCRGREHGPCRRRDTHLVRGTSYLASLETQVRSDIGSLENAGPYWTKLFSDKSGRSSQH